MDDNHNYQNPQNQMDNQQNAQPQVLQNHNTSENTYWESDITKQTMEQTSNDPNYQQDQQQGQLLNSQSQFGQSQYGNPQYSQPQSSQMNNAQNPYHQPVYYNNEFSQPPKKNLRGLMIALITILIILFVGAGTAYAFRDTLTNSYAKATKSPAEYYAFIEKSNINESVDQLTPYLDFNALDSEIAYDISSNVTLNKEALDSLLQSSLGVSISDFEAELGIPIDSFGFDAFVGTNGDYLNETVSLFLNQVDLITAEMFMDTAAQEILVRFPELSEAFLSISDDSTANTDTSYLKLITKERTADLLKRYSYIVIDHMDQVVTENTNALNIGSITTDCTELTVTITEQDLYNMVVEILEEAEDDQYMFDLLPMFQLSKEEYQTAILEALADMLTRSATPTDESIQMIVYIDQKGNIIGREIGAGSTNISFGYNILTDGKHKEYKIYASDESGANVFEIIGDQTKENDSYDGKATVVFSGTGEYSSMFSLDITYEDMRTERKDNISYQYGSFTVSSLELMGLQVMVNYDVQDDIQTNQVIFQMGAEPLITMDIQCKYSKGYEVTTPPADAEIYDITQAEPYMATMDLEDFIAKLSERLGVDLQQFIDSYMNETTY